MGETKPDPVAMAVGLIRGARAGSLATVAEGQPFASLVTPAAAPDRSLLMLLSGLSPHTRHLRVEKRCSLLLMGEAASVNPQTAPRISLIGWAEPEADAGLKRRWVARHPYAAFYADLGDFQLWRFRFESAQLVGGFASAHRLSWADLAANATAAGAIADVEPRILAHCNEDHADALAAIARMHGGPGGDWRMSACDVDGCDVCAGEAVVRVAWSKPVAGPEEVRAELIDLARAAHNRVVGPAGSGV